MITPDYVSSPQTFINTAEFQRSAQGFEKIGHYTTAPLGTFAYKEFWDEEERRCKEGHVVGGVRITGEHYAYLNFSRIKVTVGEGKKAKKYESFPRFLDMDYYYYHELERAKENKEGMIVAKSRRKGFSYKGAFNCVYEYTWYRDSVSIIAAFMGDYCEQTMFMALEMINFLNKNTDWAKRKLIDKRDHTKSGFKEMVNNIQVESGYKSEIMTMSFKDNPFKSIGKSSSIMLFEEAGKWPGLIDAYMLSKPLFSDGDIMIGIPIIYGTGGDMEGGTQDFAEMFYNPTTYGLRSYENIWDENNVGECGWFVSDSWFKLPHVDVNGNSYRGIAEDALQHQRNLIKSTGTKKAYEKHITQQPITPAEAFLRAMGNMFPTVDILRTLSLLETNRALRESEYIGDLVIDEDTGKVEWVPNTKLIPIEQFPLKGSSDAEGCVIIFEHPVEDSPYGRYIAGTDPYDQDHSTTDSLGSTIILDNLTNRIVAEYTARPATSKEYYENVRRMLVYYNAVCLYENQMRGMFDYFEYKVQLYMLADEPELLKDVIQDSRVTRKKGCHMTPQIKHWGEELIKMWLLEPYNAEGTLNVHKIRSITLLKELLAYNETGNFDRVIALMMCLIRRQELRRVVLEESQTVSDIRSADFWKRPLFAKTRNIFR
jgi:hypothetical protein